MDGSCHGLSFATVSDPALCARDAVVDTAFYGHHFQYGYCVKMPRDSMQMLPLGIILFE